VIVLVDADQDGPPLAIAGPGGPVDRHGEQCPEESDDDPRGAQDWST